MLKSVGIIDVSRYGWTALFIGIALYIIEGLLFYV
jgi:hypothetical protein